MASLLSAELIRAKRSSQWTLQLIAIVLLAVTLMLRGVITPVVSQQDLASLLSWAALYLTSMAAPIAVLSAASAEMREKRSNYGGTLWRPVSRVQLRLARLVVVLLSVLVFHVIYFGGTWIAALVMGYEDSWRLLILGLFGFIGAIGVAGLGAALARVTTAVVAVGIFLAWQFIGIDSRVVEGDHWWLWPMAWPVRLILPPAGVHQNLLILEADSPLRTESPWLALGLCIGLGVVGCVTAALAPERMRPVRRRQAKVNESYAPSVGYRPAVTTRAQAGRRRVVNALTRAALAPGLVVCLALAVLVLGFAAMTYPVDIVHGLFSYLVLPIGAGLLPVLVWNSVHGAWPLMRVHYGLSPRMILVWSLLVLVVVTLASAILGLIAGGDLVDEARRCILGLLAGYIVMLVAYLATLRAGSTISIAITIVISMFSVLIGGDVLASLPVWILAVPAWAETTTNAPRLITALVTGVTLVAVLQWRAEKALR